MSEKKKLLIKACIEHVTSRITSTTGAIADLQQAANEESKSSMGDKYETGRAMAQLEIEKLSSQLADAKSQLQILQTINTDDRPNKATHGSIVVTNQGNFFVSVSAGQIKVKDISYYCVSSASPIGLALFNKMVGDEFRLNNRDYTILDIE
jgi:transcription elongation GreA/GreB family factor